MALTLAYLYSAFRDSSEAKTPLPPPSQPGGLYLFFDTPGVIATLTADVSEPGFGGTKYDLQIRVHSPADLRELTYSIVLTGSARAATRYPNGDPLPLERGCPSVGLFGVPEVERCYRQDLRPEVFFAVRAPEQSAQVIVGQLQRNDAGFMFGQVSISATRAVSVSAGKRRYFALPAIGTTYLPQNGRDLDMPLGQGRQGYVPESLGVAVDYGELGLDARVESIAPEPVTAGSLVWGESDVSSLAPRGALVDVVAEDDSDRRLFLIGVLAGATTGVLPVVAAWIWRLVQHGRAVRRSAA